MVLRKLQIDVDLNKAVRYNPEIWGRVGDKDLVQLNVSTFDTSDDIKEVVDLTGATMYFTFARPDNTYFRDSLSVSNPDLKNGTFDYTLPANAFAQAGVFNCHFRIEEGGTTKRRTSTRDFKLIVAPDPLQGNIAMPNFASDIDQLNADIQAEIADSRAELDQALAELATASSNLDDAVVKANEISESIMNNQVVKITDTTNWQKGGKITADNGYSKAVPSGVVDWNAFTETGFYSVYATQLTANKPPAVGLYLDVEIHRRSGDTTYQRVTDITNNRTYYRVQLTGVWTAWTEGETVAGAQTKADKALTDAKADATTKANTAETNAKSHTDNYFVSKPIASGIAVYLSDTQSYTWNHANMKKGLYVEVVRYQVGTGSLDYGKFEIFLAKDFIDRNLGKACWLPMPQSTNGEKKAVKFTVSGSTGTITGYASNAASPDSSWAVSNLRME
ncbi:BppU family phage baseplate upper protein [Listeria booriae]|uniref:BppU family phage baseplate upper protein n=1 Tax=Listeria booriae TaxID=1552123 RepID=UPI00162902CB|nr:BppU family phage baseplate upper protein [Listeria booriae]MBC2370143.1 BppU family phage baseplate upper protein [Listeria booriae]